MTRLPKYLSFDEDASEALHKLAMFLVLAGVTIWLVLLAWV